MDWKTEIEQLAANRGGTLTPAAVLEAAKAPTSALHEQFEWDDTAAGEQYRLIQARDLIRRIAIKLDTGLGNQPIKVRAMFNVQRGTKEYRSIELVRGDDDAKRAIIHQMLLDLRAIERRARTYGVALDGSPELLSAIDRFLAANTPAKIAAA